MNASRQVKVTLILKEDPKVKVNLLIANNGKTATLCEAVKSSLPQIKEQLNRKRAESNYEIFKKLSEGGSNGGGPGLFTKNPSATNLGSIVTVRKGWFFSAKLKIEVTENGHGAGDKYRKIDPGAILVGVNKKVDTACADIEVTNIEDQMWDWEAYGKDAKKLAKSPELLMMYFDKALKGGRCGPATVFACVLAKNYPYLAVRAANEFADAARKNPSAAGMIGEEIGKIGKALLKKGHPAQSETVMGVMESVA